MFCENILPHLIYFLLVYKPLTRPILNKYLNCFFNKHYEIKRENTFEKTNTNAFQGIYCILCIALIFTITNLPYIYNVIINY